MGKPSSLADVWFDLICFGHSILFSKFEIIFSLCRDKYILKVFFLKTCPEVGLFRARQGPHCEELGRSLGFIWGILSRVA